MFNVAPVGAMSETGFRRSFLGQWADSDHVEHRFVTAYGQVNDAWSERFEWPLFKPLHEADTHALQALHVPMNPSVSQFDDQIVRLAKLVVGALNEKAIVAATATAGKTDGGINKLEALLQQEGLAAESLCSVLRHIQGARSRSAAHNKGSDFDLALLLDGAKDLPSLFHRLLNDLTEALDALAAEVASDDHPIHGAQLGP